MSLLLWILGHHEEAESVVRTLLIVASLLSVAIALAWRVYGARITELYERDNLSDEVLSKKKFSLGEPARNWRTIRRDLSPSRYVTVQYYDSTNAAGMPTKTLSRKRDNECAYLLLGELETSRFLYGVE